MSHVQEDYAPVLLGVAWSFTGFAMVMVCLRFYCRINYVAQIWWDDFWMAVSMLFSIATASLWTAYAVLGGACYVPLTVAETVQLNKINWASQALDVTAAVMGKVAIAALIARLQAPCKWRSIVLWLVSLVVVVYSFVQVIRFFLQCKPLSKLWNSSVPGKCWDPKNLVISGQANEATWGVADLVFAALGVQMIWPLQMPLRRKLALCCLLSLGVFAAAVTVVSAIALQADLDPDADQVRLTILLFIWDSIQVNVTIIAGCIPTIVPFLQTCGGKARRSLSQPFAILDAKAPPSPPFSLIPSSLRRKRLHDRFRLPPSLDKGLSDSHSQGTVYSGTVAHALDVDGSRSGNSWEISTDPSSWESQPSNNILVTADVEVRRSISGPTVQGYARQTL